MIVEADGLDCLTSEPINMVELNVGDWVYVPNCGAYINRGAEFNGFEKYPPKGKDHGQSFASDLRPRA